jgi:hypothetical protein
MIVSGGGHDLITPGTEAWRIFEGSSCPRELIYYPEGGHECFNVLTDLRPRMVSWLARHIEHPRAPRPAEAPEERDGREGAWPAAEAVDADFADALRGDAHGRVWNRTEDANGNGKVAHPPPTGPANGWRWPWARPASEGPRMVHRLAPAADAGPAGR